MTKTIIPDRGSIESKILLKTAGTMSLLRRIRVKQGIVLGGESNLPNGGTYYFFKGIPYAEPPVGELRFQAPVPLEKFPTPEIDCTKEGDVSFQKDPITNVRVGSENCLFLNVYTPKINTNKCLPVMVYIHGGGYLFGSGNGDLYTPLYLMQEDIVVVTLNFRLGALGFLALPEGNIPGNAGLKDQRLALQWVKENIGQFNGDANNVTLFGESAGASCVHLHVLSDTSKTLFHKAILQSGVSNMSWAMQEYSTYKATKLANLMGCSAKDPFEIGKFLKNYPNLIDFSKNILRLFTPDESRRSLPMPVKPVVEKKTPDAVVTEEPLKSMGKPNSIDIPLMMGYNTAEGIVMLVNAIKKIENFDQDLGRLIPRNINLHPDDPESIKLAKRIRDFYFKGEKLDKTKLNSFVDLFTDFNFLIDLYVAAEMHSRKQHKSPLYFYRFDYVGALNIYKKMFQFDHLKGACHADELFYIFQSAIGEEPWEDRDKKIVLKMSKLWANFAKYGNPTPGEGEQFVDCVWEPVRKIGAKDKFNLNAFIIDEKQKMLENPDVERIDFWRSVYRDYNGLPTGKL